MLGSSRLRRDRVAVLAAALESEFLTSIVDEQLHYARIAGISAAHPRRVFDLEVEELHNFVAEGVVVHNCAAPFKTAEFDILYGTGISKEGSLLDVGVDMGLIKKSGAWFTYEGDQLGQGRENARGFLRDNPTPAEVETRIKSQLGIGEPRRSPRTRSTTRWSLDV